MRRVAELGCTAMEKGGERDDQRRKITAAEWEKHFSLPHVYLIR
jgi:hypothetical protein